MQNISLDKKKISSSNNTKSQTQLKTLYPFIKGIPPSSNWSNHFTSLLFSEGKYLIYISNSFIIILDLISKNFSQILSSHKISSKEKPNIIISISKEKFLTILNSGDFVIFGLNNEGNFIEDLLSNKIENKFCPKVKCGVYDKKQNIIIVSNEVKIFGYFFEFDNENSKECNLYNIYVINNINGKEYFITDIILITNNKDNYFAVSNNIGDIIIYKYNAINYNQILIININ